MSQLKAFAPVPTLPFRTSARVSRATCSPTMQKSGPRAKGFSNAGPPPSRQPSDGQKRREAAAKRYDDMAAKGFPEYTIWMRLKEGGVADEGEQMPWLPVGSLAVPRSSQVPDAIFDAEDDLMQGAIRLYPNLQKEERDNIEFGYQLRQFDDEEIRLAERAPTSGWQATLTGLFRKWQNPLNA